MILCLCNVGAQTEDRPPRYSDVTRRPQPTYGAASQPTSYYDNYQQQNYQQPDYQHTNYGQANYQHTQPSPYAPAHQAHSAYIHPQTQTETHTQVVYNQPVPQTIIREPKPSSHVWLSLFTCLCCCFICGLIALIIGQEVIDVLLYCSAIIVQEIWRE